MKFSSLTPDQQDIIKRFAAPELKKKITKNTIFTKQELSDIREILDKKISIPLLQILKNIRENIG